LGFTPWAPPHAYVNRRWGNPAGTQHNPILRHRVWVHDDPPRADKLRKGWTFRAGTWNIYSRTSRAGELVEAWAERRMEVACVQETRWRGSGCRFFGAIGKRYKLFWMGNKAKTDGVGIFVAEKWVDIVVSVDRHSDRTVVLKTVLGDYLLNVFTVYAPACTKMRVFWVGQSNEVIQISLGPTLVTMVTNHCHLNIKLAIIRLV